MRFSGYRAILSLSKPPILSTPYRSIISGGLYRRCRHPHQHPHHQPLSSLCSGWPFAAFSPLHLFNPTKSAILSQPKTNNRYSHRSSRMIMSQSRNPSRSLDSSQLGPIPIPIPWLHFLLVLLSRSWSHWLWSLGSEAFPVTASRCGGVHFFLDVCHAGSHFDG
jgi:hypothetical protein